jgi:hypothetical protein
MNNFSHCKENWLIPFRSPSLLLFFEIQKPPDSQLPWIQNCILKNVICSDHSFIYERKVPLAGEVNLLIKGQDSSTTLTTFSFQMLKVYKNIYAFYTFFCVSFSVRFSTIFISYNAINMDYYKINVTWWTT